VIQAARLVLCSNCLQEAEEVDQRDDDDDDYVSEEDRRSVQEKMRQIENACAQMNEMQRTIFNTVQSHIRLSLAFPNTPRLYAFVSGGAGIKDTGLW
jgi:hypothetical protein